MPHRFFDPVPEDAPRRKTKALAFSFHDLASESVWLGGGVVEIDDTRFVIDIPSKEVKTWPGTRIPIPMLVFYVMADRKERTLWVPKDRLYTNEGLPYLGTRYRALRDAMQATGRPEELPSIGDELWMRWIGVVDSGFGRHPRKLWEMKCITAGGK